MGTKNKAGVLQPVFVLRAADPAAPYIVRQWVTWRSIQKNITEEDREKFVEALVCANDMAEWYDLNVLDKEK